MTAETPHIPPHAIESEEAVLGAMMMSSFAIEVAAELGLRADDFYRPSHRTIFEAIRSLADRNEVDELALVRYLKAQNQLGDVGGPAAVLSLAERVPAVANARAYVRDVIDTATLRRLVETGHGIAKLGYEHPDAPPALLLEASRMFDDLTAPREGTADEWTNLGDELGPMLDDLQERKDRGGQLVGLPTGLEVIDERWGGLQASRLYIAAGRPGMGKSAWLSQVCEHVALDQQHHVALFNFEMAADQQAKRAAARHGNASLHRMTSGMPTDRDLEDVSATRMRIYENARRMHINRSAFLTVQQIQWSARRLHRRLQRNGGAGLSLIGVDYIQLVETPQRRGDSNRATDLSKISRGLKALAMELRIPVIALSQLNRAVEERTPPVPVLSDLRESGAIEQDADVVLLLFRPDYYAKDDTPIEWQGKAQAITAKWRDGVPGTDVIGWDGPRTRFVHARDAVPHPFVVGGSNRGGEIV